jgi:diacylglycerol kinase (ATP)
LPDPVFVVINPHSGKGRGKSLIEPVLRALAKGGGRVEHGLTTGPGDEARLTESAIAQGFRSVVAVGGDGTWSHVGNAIVRSRVAVSLGLVPAGTGCDLAKSLGIPARDVAECARIVLQGRTRTIDVGRIEDRYFLNVAGFGFDIAVIEDSWKVRWLGGDLLYLYCALRQIYSFRGFKVAIEADGVVRPAQELLMLVVANARVFGGGFRIAPEADLGDGRLDAVSFGNVGVLRRLRFMVKLLGGTHAGTPGIDATRARSFRLRFEHPPVYETDGEWNRAQSAEVAIESVSSALRVLVPEAS